MGSGIRLLQAMGLLWQDAFTFEQHTAEMCPPALAIAHTGGELKIAVPQAGPPGGKVEN